MRHSTVVLGLSLILLGLHATDCTAQAPPSHAQSSTVRPSAGISHDAALTSGHSWFSKVGTAVGAALIGAGVGFFASQVALGDWDQQDGHGRINRAAWAGVGGALGFTLGFEFPIGGRAGAFGASQLAPSSGPGLALPSGRLRITAQEIAGSGAVTAYDVVKNLRSEWLLQRQAHTWAEIVNGADIPVYLNSQLLGGLDALSTVSAQDVQAIYRFNPSQATIRWGAGHENGAIMVVTKG